MRIKRLNMLRLMVKKLRRKEDYVDIYKNQ